MMMMMMVVLAQVLDGWLANYLMMSIASGGAGQKKIGKVRQQSSFTLGKVFFLVLRSSKSNGSQQQMLVRMELGGHFRKPLRFRPFQKVDNKDFSKQFHDTLGCNFCWLEYYSAAAAAGAGGGHNTQSNH